MLRKDVLLLIVFLIAADARADDYRPADPDLKIVALDSDKTESFLSVRVDTQGQLFVGGREALFVYEPNADGAYQPRKLLYRFPAHSWVYDIEIRGNDLYVLTLSALYLLPDAVSKRDGLQPKKLLWGVPNGHVHQCFHALAWGPEGDLYISMGDPLWYYGDFARPDHWGYWTFFTQPEGTKIPYHGQGGMFRIRPDGTRFQIVARGLRNPCGIAFDRDWNLFANDNDHEGLPALYVPGRLLHVTPHANFHWPRGWMLHKTPERADLLETMFDGMGRAVPVGQSYYDETFLPEKYRHNLLIARWCTRTVARYPLEQRGASFKTTEHPLLIGKDMVRPVGVAVGRGGRIFATLSRMAHNEGSPVYPSDLVMITRSDDAKPFAFAPYDATTVTLERLWSELGDPSWQRRYRAHIELTRRGGAIFKDANKRLAGIKASDPALPSLIWLAAQSGAGSLHLLALTAHPEPKVRAQAIRALTEFPDQIRGEPIFTPSLQDPDPHVQHAGILAHYSSKVQWDNAIRQVIERGPARSDDTYLRQAATLLLAERATLKQLETMCLNRDVATRMAGVLAIGSRLTIPEPHAPIRPHLPLANWREESANIIDYTDGKLDLRKSRRVGTYTFAEHWKADMHTVEQELMFKRLRSMLTDDDEKIRLQSAFYLSLLNDSRSEPEIAKVRSASMERKLALAPIQAINEVWAIGPFDDGKNGLDTTHPPEQTAIDLATSYAGADKKKFVWTPIKPGKRHFQLDQQFGPCDQSSFYAYTRLESSAKQRVQLLVGSDDGVKIWLNGKLAFTNPVSRAALPFQDVVPLDLEPGSNDLLVRVNNVSGECGLYLHVRHLHPVAVRMAERLTTATLADRLKNADKNAGVTKEFLAVDWSEAVKTGDAKRGRQLFESLACAKCHAVTPDANVIGGPSLADAKKRFTIPYLVESILLPSKQISPVFKATHLELKTGIVIAGLVVNETADKLELLLPDANRRTITRKEIDTRRLIELSPMPAGVVRRPDELRDLLAYLLSDNKK